MGISSWLFKDRDIKNTRGRACNVVDIRGINYKDFVREFGKPNKKFTENYSDCARWNFETPNGEKFNIYFDTSDYITNKIRREKLDRHGPVDIEDIDEFTIRGSMGQITMLKMYFHFIYGVGDLERLDREKTFDYLFKEWNDR